MYAPQKNPRLTAYLTVHVVVCTLACGCVWFPSYTNECGEKPMDALSANSGYVEITGTGESARPLLTLFGVHVAIMASAAASAKQSYGRAVYVAFLLVWAAVMVTWHSPCGDHHLSPGLYMALSCTVAATLAVQLAEPTKL